MTCMFEQNNKVITFMRIQNFTWEVRARSSWRPVISILEGASLVFPGFPLLKPVAGPPLHTRGPRSHSQMSLQPPKFRNEVIGAYDPYEIYKSGNMQVVSYTWVQCRTPKGTSCETRRWRDGMGQLRGIWNGELKCEI